MLAAGAWALLAGSSLLLGAFVALRFKVPPRRVGEIMGFGAGALLGALAYELLPNTRVSDVTIWVAFGVGSIVFYLADGLVSRHATSGGGSGVDIALGALLDGIPESVVLGMSLAVGGSVSIGFLVAVLVSNLPEGLSASGEMGATHSSRAIYLMWTGIAVVAGISGAVGYLVANSLPGSDGRYVQAFAAGAVLTMLADSMFPEAFEEGGRVVALLTALGFAAAALLTTVE